MRRLLVPWGLSAGLLVACGGGGGTLAGDGGFSVAFVGSQFGTFSDGGLDRTKLFVWFYGSDEASAWDTACEKGPALLGTGSFVEVDLWRNLDAGAGGGEPLTPGVYDLSAGGSVYVGTAADPTDPVRQASDDSSGTITLTALGSDGSASGSFSVQEVALPAAVPTGALEGTFTNATPCPIQ
ncbi:MAG TPA: hypothetical protein VMB50_16995 [Myxococcales bacterium]|nr:hypothetical protein [Myxococcales bacterium]